MIKQSDKLLIWVEELSLPYKIDNLYYISSPYIKYHLLYDDSTYDIANSIYSYLPKLSDGSSFFNFKLISSLEEINEDNYVEHFTYYVKNLFNALWSKDKPTIIKLGLTEDQIVFYYEETIMMLANWLNQFLIRLRHEMQTKNVRESFTVIKPVAMEQGLNSDLHMVRGFIDYIEEYTDSTTPAGEKKVRVMDYKTSKSSELTDSYRLQLAIYALLYEETYGKKPNKVGLWFLKNGKEVCVNVDEELINHAKFEIEQIHFNTQTKTISDYPMKSSPLCKWSTGQCDFFEQCFPNGKRRW